jgi:hypothetical protein
MNGLKHIRSRIWVALMLGAFLVSLSFAYRFVRQETDRVRRLTQTREELQFLIGDARRQLNQLSVTVHGEVSPPEKLFEPWIAAKKLAIRENRVLELPETYRRHTLRLNIENLPPAELQMLVEVAENAQPAWHVREIKLTPREGVLQGELMLEALDKSASAL